jgi:hypothetical protein
MILEVILVEAYWRTSRLWVPRIPPMGKPEVRPGGDVEIEERVREAAREAVDEAERRAIEEIEALEEDLDEAKRRAIEEIEALEEHLEREIERAGSLETELDEVRAELVEARAKAEKAESRIVQLERAQTESEGGASEEVARRKAAEAEAERLRGELETLRKEIVERVREVVGARTAARSGQRTPSPPAKTPTATHETGVRQHTDQASPPRAPSATRRRRRFGWPLGVIVGAVLAAGLAGLITGTTTAGSNPPPPPPKSSEPAVARYERALDDQFQALAETRHSQLERLHQAEAAGAQSAAAQRVASAHARAARALVPLIAPAQLRPSKAAIVRALHDVADAYRRVGAAAATRQPQAYARAAADVRQAEKALRRSLKENSQAVVG